MPPVVVLKGGGFLLGEVDPSQVFTPEEFTEAQLMMGKTAEEFLEREVRPRAEEIEEKKPGVTEELLRKAGSLGLLAIDIPEAYGGLGLDLITSTLIKEKIGGVGSFSTAYSVHTVIGSLPIVYFGTRAQKGKYLPAVATGERFGAYALTEPGSGSDALAAKTRAVLSPDGRFYILHGRKQFTTNAGFADFFITYAKVDGEHFTAFLVERRGEGVSLGPEEKKMGMKGSSTRSVVFEGVRVPVENVLGEVGRGHIVAFNTLNIGRLKLGASCLGSCKVALKEAIRYAKQRVQFGKPIADFGLIQRKLAEMALKTYAAESMIYRTAGLIDQVLKGLNLTAEEAGKETARAIAEYAIECSMDKIYGSEALDFVVDEMVQIFGGYGYIEEYPAARAYRDARINRIWEGTNEINRLLIPDLLIKRAGKGELPLLPVLKQLPQELLALRPLEAASGTPLSLERGLLGRAKKAALLVAGLAFQRHGEKLREEEEILADFSDMVIEVFAMESSLLRALKTLTRDGEAKARMKVEMARVLVFEGLERIEGLAKGILAAILKGDELKTQLAALRALLRRSPLNTIAAKRAIAGRLLEAEDYRV